MAKARSTPLPSAAYTDQQRAVLAAANTLQNGGTVDQARDNAARFVAEDDTAALNAIMASAYSSQRAGLGAALGREGPLTSGLAAQAHEPGAQTQVHAHIAIDRGGDVPDYITIQISVPAGTSAADIKAQLLSAAQDFMDTEESAPGEVIGVGATLVIA
jgi:hypothetical protein